MPELDSFHDPTGLDRKTIFAVVSRPIPTDVKGKTIRRVLIFDNHPDSLHLVSKTSIDRESDDAVWRREKRRAFICGSILIAMIAAGVLWALWS
jgi:hypothetical protein